MDNGEGSTLPEGPQRRMGVIPFQMASPASAAAPLHTPAPPQEPQPCNGVIPLQMASPASSAGPLSPPASPHEQRRPGSPSPGAISRTDASAAIWNACAHAPKKRRIGLFLALAVRDGTCQCCPSPDPTTDNQGPPHGITPLVGPATAQATSFGSSNIRSQHTDGARQSHDQIAESGQPQDGSQSGEDLAPHDGCPEWLETKEYLATSWWPFYEVEAPLIDQIPLAARSAPAVEQLAQAATEYEYPWPSHPQGEKRMEPVEEWTARKKQITRDMVYKGWSDLLAWIDRIQPIAPTGCVGQVAEETVRKAESELLARDESIPAQPVQATHVPVPAQPVLEVHTESVQTEEAPTLEVGSQPAVPQPTPIVPEPSAEVPLEAAMSVPAVPQPALAKKACFETVPTAVPTQATTSEPGDSQPLQTVLAAKAKVATDGVVRELAASQQAPTASEPSSQTVTSAVAQPTPVVLDGTEKVAVQAVVSEPALSQQAPAALKPSPSEEDDSARSDSDDDEWWPALQWQATSESDPSDEEWWPAFESQAPSERTGIRQRRPCPDPTLLTRSMRLWRLQLLRSWPPPDQSRRRQPPLGKARSSRLLLGRLGRNQTGVG
ncbi:uncharacterized protein N7515_000327 [Penicillium bovifimosum]|uniref:Uncharacterized protein n=1 Tax=Penicillium bovifimosum TaxID=126998 RepID=A0A9W9LBG5_9EURO|nr:uncharacterized protein N7515_000327 [Penicillium bovifimosum]KAJ5145763.1 hypothetical protein N7515_000327 [Penicillium bovifimosum]